DPMPGYGEGVRGLLVLPVPDRHGATTAGRELSAVAGAERHGIGTAEVVGVVAGAGEQGAAGLPVPDLHQLIRPDGGQVLAVGVERDAARGATVSLLDPPDHLTRFAVPDLDGPVPARGGEEFAVGAERQAVDLDVVVIVVVVVVIVKDDRSHPAEPHE